MTGKFIPHQYLRGVSPGRFTLTQAVGQKLEFAINRNGGVPSDVEWLSTGDNFKKVCLLASGEYVLAPVVHAVKKLFEDMDPVTVVIDFTINFHEALKTCEATKDLEALYVCPMEWPKIITQANGVVPTSVTMKPRRLKKTVDYQKFKGELPKVHKLDPTGFVAMLATELYKVRSGKQSDVLKKGRHCLFCVGNLAVRVSWDPNNSEWDVDIWEIDGRRLDTVGVVFSCN